MSKPNIIDLDSTSPIPLDPEKKYLIVFDRHVITMEDAHQIVKKLNRLGIESLGVAIEDLNGIKIIEAPKTDKE